MPQLKVFFRYLHALTDIIIKYHMANLSICSTLKFDAAMGILFGFAEPVLRLKERELQYRSMIRSERSRLLVFIFVWNALLRYKKATLTYKTFPLLQH